MQNLVPVTCFVNGGLKAEDVGRLVWQYTFKQNTNCQNIPDPTYPIDIKPNESFKNAPFSTVQGLAQRDFVQYQQSASGNPSAHYGKLFAYKFNADAGGFADIAEWRVGILQAYINAAQAGQFGNSTAVLNILNLYKDELARLTDAINKANKKLWFVIGSVNLA